MAQAAFAIGFLDTSWDFNRCEVQKGKTTSGSVDQTAQLRPTINIVGVVAERPVKAAPRRQGTLHQVSDIAASHGCIATTSHTGGLRAGGT